MALLAEFVIVYLAVLIIRKNRSLIRAFARLETSTETNHQIGHSVVPVPQPESRRPFWLKLSDDCIQGLREALHMETYR